MGDGGIAAQLELAHHERTQGRVVLAVLAGSPERAAEHWRRWAAQHRRFVLAAQAAAGEPALAELVAQAPWLHVLRGARAQLARTAELAPAELAAAIDARGEAELARWLHELAASDPVAMVAAWLVAETRTRGSRPAPLPATALLAALERLGAPVALLWVTATPDATWLDRALRTAGELALRAPALPIAVAAPRPVLEPVARALAGSALGSLVRRGLILLDETPATPLSHADDRPAEPTQRRRAGPASSNNAEGDTRGAPRSRPEAELYAALESDPRTRGHFALNQRVQLPGGLWEIDLLAAPARLAVEIDGWHHFREPTNYRRDRQKDVRLQRGDYFIMRVLAEDIQGDRLAYTVDEIACILLELSSGTRTAPPRGDTRR